MNSPDNPILIMAGGTGGHVYPALAVAQAFIQQGHTIEWLGTEQGIESRLVPENSIKLHNITIKGFRKTGIAKQLMMPFNLIKSIVAVCKIISTIKPKLVLGFGGYVSGPGGIAAKLKAKPLVIHEQNAVAGTTNRLLSPLSTLKFSAFPEALKKSIHCGNPVRAELFKLNKQPVTTDRPLHLLVLGGSLGAKKLNEIIPLAASNCEFHSDLDIRHQTGKRWSEECKKNYNGATKNTGKMFNSLSVDAYIDDMAEAYQWADVVICRAGAMTVWEVATVGVAALFIPFPHAIDDHQSANAQWLVNNNAGLVIQEKELTAKALTSIIDDWCANRNQLNELANNAKSCSIGDSADIIVNHSLEALNV